MERYRISNGMDLLLTEEEKREYLMWVSRNYGKQISDKVDQRAKRFRRLMKSRLDRMVLNALYKREHVPGFCSP